MARRATHANRRRIKGNRGRELLKQRGELIERSFTHAYETGGMRTGRSNVAKRVLIHAAGFNPALVMRERYGMRKPRNAGALASILAIWALLSDA